MCDVKAGIPVGAIAAGVAAAIVAVHVAPALPVFLVTAVVTVYALAAVGLFGLVRVVRYGSLRKPRARQEVKIYRPAALPAPPRAIEAPRPIPWVVAATIALEGTATPREGAQRARIPAGDDWKPGGVRGVR